MTTEQRRALDALLSGADNAGAAQAAGCSERTLKRWKTEATFKGALQAAQDAALDATTGALVAASASAVALLHNVIDDDAAQMSHRLRAAGTVIDATLRWHELRSLAQRIAALEGAVNAKP